MLRFLGSKLRETKGAAMVEYGMLVAGIGLVAAGATSILGHKTNDLVASIAAVLPGVHGDDNAPITAGAMIETGPNAAGNLALDVANIVANAGTNRLGVNLGAPDLVNLVVEAN